MGKFEVLDYLTALRLSGDDDYRRYGEVHDGLRQQGMSLSYTSVWRTLNGLYGDSLVEVEFEVNGLQRTAMFRARISSRLHSSQMKRVHNILQVQDEKGRCGPNGGSSGRGRGKAGLIAARRGVSGG